MELVGVEVPIWLALIFVVLLAYCKYMTMTFDTFKGTPELKGPKPIPVLGNLVPIFSKGLFEWDKLVIGKYGKVVPIFLGRVPYLIVADVDMAREILIKQFDNFNKRGHFGKVPYPLEDMLLVANGEHWKWIRSGTSPAFTAEKLRRLHEPMTKCCENLVKNIRAEGPIIDMREIIGAFTMDTIAASAFGMEIDSQTDKNNAFVRNADKSFSGELLNAWVLLSFFLPFLNRWIEMTFMPKKAIQFFVKTIKEIMASRTDADSKRPDFIQVMLNAQKENGQSKSKRALDESAIIAQGIIFFIAGFDTVSNACSHVLYCLAMHQEVQEKLYEEVLQTLEQKEDPGYDTLKDMTFLEMVINESIRLYPVLAHINRVAEKDITLKGVLIPKDTTVAVPVNYFHNDPEIYPDPDKFDPYRFTEEAKASRDPMYFLPFGYGPRHCAGMRLSQMEVRLAVFHIVKNFKIMACDETPIHLKRSGMFGRPIGMKLKFKERETEV